MKKGGKGKRNSANIKVITVTVSSMDGAWGRQVQTDAGLATSFRLP